MSCWHFKKWWNLIVENSFRFAAILNGKYRSVPVPPPFPAMDNLHHRGTFVTMDEPTLTHHYHPKSTDYTWAHFRGCTFHGFWYCVMTNIYHCSIVSLSWKSSVLCLFLPPYLQPLATTDIFTVSIVLPFPECHIIGSIQCVAFSDLFPSLSNMSLLFLHVFPLLDSSLHLRE